MLFKSVFPSENTSVLTRTPILWLSSNTKFSRLPVKPRSSSHMAIFSIFKYLFCYICFLFFQLCLFQTFEKTLECLFVRVRQVVVAEYNVIALIHLLIHADLPAQIPFYIGQPEDIVSGNIKIPCHADKQVCGDGTCVFSILLTACWVVLIIVPRASCDMLWLLRSSRIRFSVIIVTSFLITILHNY